MSAPTDFLTPTVTSSGSFCRSLSPALSWLVPTCLLTHPKPKMSRAKPVELPSRTFAKQSDATDFFKKMLNRYVDGQRIGPEDSRLLFELLQRHPDEKIGPGIDYFYRDRNPDQPTSCFHILRIDGQRTDFSYPSCIKGTKPTAEHYFYRACRFAVSPYLIEAKNALFAKGEAVRTPSGEVVTKDSSEYRHTEPSFKKLIEGFRRLRGLDVSMGLFVEDRDMQYNVRFLDRSIAQDFINYHKEHARLELFSRVQNRDTSSDSVDV